MHVRAKVLYEFEGETSNGELVIKEGEVLNILRQDVGDGWWEAQNTEGVRGLVPEGYLEIMGETDGQTPSPDHGQTSPDSSTPIVHNNATSPDSPDSSVSPGFDRQDSVPAQEDDWDDDWDDDQAQPEQKSAVTRQQSQVSQSSVSSTDSGLNGQGSYGLHGPSRGFNKRNSEAAVKTGTVSKKFASRFSVFAKSGGEAYLLGAANTKKSIPANNEVRIVEIDDGPNWEDPGGQWRFSCEITNPKKESKLKGMKSYIAYQLTPSNTGIRVSRRYKHFDWLYERLAEKYTLLCVPQLPDKQVTGRYEESFIEKRMDGLQRWMNRMTAHPIISQCDTFQHFISCTDEKQWKTGKRRAEKDDLVGASFLQTITPPERTLDVAEVEKQHENFNKFVKSMNESMVVILQSCHESRKRHIGPFKREFVKVGHSFKSLGDTFEIDTRPKSVKLTEAIRNTGKTYEDIGQFFAQQPTKDLVPFEEFLREYHGMILTFPDMIQFHKHTISTVKECQTRREEQKMEFEEAEAVKTRADVVSYAMMAEINHFQQERVKNFKEAMEAYLMEQIKFYQNITSKLEDALGKFQDI